MVRSEDHRRALRPVRVLLLAASVGLAHVLAHAQHAPRFTPGHIFVLQRWAEACVGPYHPHTFIREINPKTGESWYFADSLTSPLCNSYGLDFTPDGTRLRVGNWGRSDVLDFTPDGIGRVTYDYVRDGILYPFWNNCIAFDALGDCYINCGGLILRFRGDQRPAEVFTLPPYLIAGRGALAFAPDGYLYVAGGLPQARSLVRYPRNDHRGEVVDTFPDGWEVNTVAVDRAGNAVIAVYGRNPSGTRMYRYDAATPTTRREIPSLNYPVSYGLSLRYSLRDDAMYIASGFGVHRVDSQTGASEQIYEGILGVHAYTSGGMAIYDPPMRGDLNCDFVVNFEDIPAFVLAIADPEGFATTHGQCYIGSGDFNGDKRADFDDIEGFVACLIAGGCS